MTAEERSIESQAKKMVKENVKRKKELFPSYDPITGEGLPGPRTKVTIEDLTDERETWYVPDQLLQCEPIWDALLRLKSVHAACEAVYGSYSYETRDSAVQEALRTRAKYDFYFYAFHAKIVNKEFGEDINFLLRPAQIKLVSEFERQRLSRGYIRVIVDKARQWGGSTATDIYMSWIQVMWEESKDSLIVGHQSDSSVEVRDMLFRAINSLPPYFLYKLGEDYDETQPRIKGGGTPNIYVIPSRNCKIKTGTALNPAGPRSGHQALVHYTEVAFWPETEKLDPRKMIQSGSSSVPTMPNTMVVLESTANGQNFFKDEWDRAEKVDEYGEKVSLFYQVFVAWFEIELYTLDPPDMLEWAKTLLRRRDDKVNHWDYLFWLWSSCGATLEGIYWYWQKMREYQSLEDMQQEFPSNAVESFKYSGNAEFDQYLIEQRRKSFCKPPLFIGDIEGKSPKGPESIENLRTFRRDVGPLKIWDYPDKEFEVENRYLISVDIGGKYATSDYSVMTVFDRLDMMLTERGELNEDAGPTVVAEWYGHLDPDLLAIKSAQLAKYYNDALLVIESNTAYSRMNGTDNDDVTELFFPILTPLYDNIYSAEQSEKDMKMQKPHRLGFWTSASKKISIVKYMGTALRDCLWTDREEGLYKEMTWFMKFPNGKYGAIPGKHDDRVMSRAIGLWVSRFDWRRYPVFVRPTKQERQKRIGSVMQIQNRMTNMIT